MKNVIVVGSGPAGMMAAISASKCGHRVTLLEGNNKIAKNCTYREKVDAM